MFLVSKERTLCYLWRLSIKLKCVMETSNITHGLKTMQEPLGAQFLCYKNYLIKNYKANFLLLP